MARFINAYLRVVLRFPKVFLLGLLGMTLLLGGGVFKLTFDHSIEAFMPEGDPDYIQYEKTKEIYGDNDRFMIMAVSAAPLWSAQSLDRMNDLLRDIEAFKDFDGQLENQRLQRLDRAADTAFASYDDLAAAFSDDPAFLRFIDRHVAAKAKNRAFLSPGQMARLTEKARQIVALKRQQCVDAILSPFTAEDISGAFDTLETYPLIEEDVSGRRMMPRTETAVARFKQRLKKNPAYRGGIYSVNPDTGEIQDFAFVVKFAEGGGRMAVVAELIDIVESYDNLDIIVSGVPYVNHHFNKYMQADLYRNIPLVLLVVIVVFYYNFRSVRGVLLPFFTLAMAEIWTFGLMGHLGYAITTVGITVPPLLIAVGSSYSIHVLNQYYAEFSRIDPKRYKKGLQSVMSHISFTVALAGLTTFAAFMTLLSSRVSAIQEWGVFSGIGIIFAVFISITLISAMLALMPHRFPSALASGAGRKITMVDRVLFAAAKGAVRHYRKVFVVVLAVVAVSVAGMLRLRVDTEFLHYFKPSDPVRASAIAMGEKFGGGWGFDIIIDSNEIDGVKSAQFLSTVEKVRRWLESEKNDDLNIGRTDAFSDFIKRMHMAMYNDDPAYYKIPESDLAIMDYLEIFSGEDSDSDGRVDAFEPFVDRGYKATNILVRLARKSSERIGTTEVTHIIEKTRGYLKANLPPAYDFQITGYPVINVKLAHYVVSGQMMGLLLSFGFVFIVIAALYRKLLAGPLALIDMGVTVIINFGIMGWFGIELDMVTSVIAAITIGIGVDDTIHFLNTYRFYKTDDRDVAETIEKTLSVSGKAILFTSLALVCGFLVQVTSNFMPIVLFALLISLTMVNTTIGSILLIPAAIRLTGIDLNRKKWL
ncbi:MAG: efflux RND transporter permease subunit [Thermodesulfobacteriota bacterium]